jgi:hypothetical protein
MMKEFSLGPLVAVETVSRLNELAFRVAMAADLAAPVTVKVTGMFTGEPATASAQPAVLDGL